MAEGAEKLRRQGESHVVMKLRREARLNRTRSQKDYHAEPQITATYLSIAWFLDDAANTLAEVYKMRREVEDMETTVLDIHGPEMGALLDGRTKVIHETVRHLGRHGFSGGDVRDIVTELVDSGIIRYENDNRGE